MDDHDSHQMRLELEAYIADLEAEEPHLSLSEAPITVVNLKANEPPIGSNQRVMEADARRRARALSRRSN